MHPGGRQTRQIGKKYRQEKQRRHIDKTNREENRQVKPIKRWRIRVIDGDASMKEAKITWQSQEMT